MADDNGGYTTELTQHGVLTAISDTSITARSADGFTQTYVLQAGLSKDNLAVNDTVTIFGTRVNGAATATGVNDDEPSGGGSGGRP